MYIVFEGIFGCGKSTQIEKLAEYLRSKGHNLTLTREPGGTEVSENIRTVVQGTVYKEDMEPITDAYLYAASRAEALRKIVKPALEKGDLVIADRSFVTSLAYQGYAQGFGLENVLKVNESAIDGFLPDYVFYIDIDAETSSQRTSDHDGDKWEKKDLDFAQKIVEGYKRASELPMFRGKWINIDGNRSISEVQDSIRTAIDKIIP